MFIELSSNKIYQNSSKLKLHVLVIVPLSGMIHIEIQVGRRGYSKNQVRVMTNTYLDMQYKKYLNMDNALHINQEIYFK